MTMCLTNSLYAQPGLGEIIWGKNYHENYLRQLLVIVYHKAISRFDLVMISILVTVFRFFNLQISPNLAEATPCDMKKKTNVFLKLTVFAL